MRILHSRRRRRAGGLAAAALLTAAAVAATTAMPATAETDHVERAELVQQIAVPAYFYPADEGAELWQRLGDAAPTTGIAVANPFSGPGAARDPNYGEAIAAASAAGIKVLGYVPTGYLGSTGTRATSLGETTPDAWTAEVQQDIETWYELYGDDGLAGIFFDEVQNVCGPEDLYVNAYGELDRNTKRRHHGAFTVINPGIETERCYEDVGDVSLTFESTYEAYREWTPPKWHRKVDPDRFWHLVHSTETQEQMLDAISLSKERGAGYVYVTPDVMANPWDTLPQTEYWQAELEAAMPSDQQDPTIDAPDKVKALRTGSTDIRLSWHRAKVESGRIAGYDTYVDGVRVTSTIGAETRAEIDWLRPDTAYSIEVRARDRAGNTSPFSEAVTVTTAPADADPPAALSDLASSETGLAHVRLTWTESPESDVVAYDITRDGAPLLSMPAWLVGGGGSVTVPVSGLEPATEYSFDVAARDASGNVSTAAELSVTTEVPSGDPISDAVGRIGDDAVTYQAQFHRPFDFHHVFIDVDNDTATGFETAGVGADYLLENGWFYRHVGVGWSWEPVPGDSPLISFEGGLYVWRVPLSALGEGLGAHRVVFQGSGSSPEYFTEVIPV